MGAIFFSGAAISLQQERGSLIRRMNLLLRLGGMAICAAVLPTGSAEAGDYARSIVVQRGDVFLGETLTELGNLDANENGEVAFGAASGSGGIILVRNVYESVRGDFGSDRVVVRSGDVVGGVELTGRGTPSINAAGDLVFQAPTAESGANGAIFTERAGTLGLAAIMPMVVDGATLRNLGPVPRIDEVGGFVFSSGGADIQGVRGFRGDPTNNLSLLVEPGDLITGHELTLIDQVSGQTVSGEYAVVADYSNGGTPMGRGLFTSVQGLLLSTGDGIDGLVVDQLRNVAINDSGEVVVLLDISSGGSPAGQAIWSSVRGFVLVTGDVLDGLTLGELRDPELANTGEIILGAFYTDGLGAPGSGLISTDRGAVVLQGDIIDGKIVTGAGGGGNSEALAEDGSVIARTGFADGTSALVLARPLEGSQCLAELEACWQTPNPDLNRDRSVDLLDSVLLRRRLAGFPVP